MTARSLSRLETVRALVAYFALSSLFFILLLLVLTPPPEATPTLYGIQINKIAYYRLHYREFNMLFLGDSRAYTDIRSEIVDAETGYHALNMASFGLWMPVMNLQFRDIFPLVPKDAVVIWSLSALNFQPNPPNWWIPGQYDFPMRTAIEYLFEGYPAWRVLQEYDEAPFSPVRRLKKGYHDLLAGLDRTLWRTGFPSGAPRSRGSTPHVRADSLAGAQRYHISAAAIKRSINHWKAKPYVIAIHPFTYGSLTTSLEVYTRGGSYIRVELIPQFFRDEQTKLFPPRATGPIPCNYAPHPVYWATFLRILRFARAEKIHLILNRVEDAPASFSAVSERDCLRRFMDTTVRTTVERSGFRYLSVDTAWGTLRDDDYFDQGHLNSTGNAIYSRLLGKALASFLPPPGR